MDNVKFEFYIGDTYTRDFIIAGYTDAIDKVYLTVKKQDDDKNYLLQKSLVGDTSDGITLTDVQYEDDGTTIKSRTYNVLFDADDTEGMKADIEYPFDVEIVTNKDGGNAVKSTIIKGNMILKSATTRIWNEA